MKKYIYALSALLFIVVSTPMLSAQQVIRSVAGKGYAGYTGDTELAQTCLLHWPESIAIDDSNDIYIADANNNVIRKINQRNGIITTVVGDGYQFGTGLGDFAGDGGPASAARLSYPSGVAVDHIGNLYIADQRNNRIRKVDTFGVITTIAGSAVGGFSGDGAAATNAKLYHPTRICLDVSGNIYVADSGNNRIRKIDASGNINTVAGTGTKGSSGDGGLATMAQLFNPMDMAVDVSGNMFIADYVNNKIRKVDVSGTITTYAGIGIAGYSGDEGQATNANIYEPSGILVDAAGNVYFSDLANFRVRKIDPSGIITTVAGNGVFGYNGDNIPANTAQLGFPEGLALDARGQLYLADKSNDRIRIISGVLAVNQVNDNVATIQVYPNPGNGTFTVNSHSPFTEDMHITLVSVTGQKLLDVMSATNKVVTLSSDNIAPGIYFLNATTAHSSFNERVMVR